MAARWGNLLFTLQEIDVPEQNRLQVVINVPVDDACTHLLSKLTKTNKAKSNNFLLNSSINAVAEKSGFITKLIPHLWHGFESLCEL